MGRFMWERRQRVSAVLNGWAHPTDGAGGRALNKAMKFSEKLL